LKLSVTPVTPRPLRQRDAAGRLRRNGLAAGRIPRRQAIARRSAVRN